jgi:hypothetical protein
MRMQLVPLPAALILLAGIATPTRSIEAQDMREGNAPQDRIEVISHFPLAHGPVEQLLATQHYGRHYLYAQRADGRVTVIDITNATAPSRVANVEYPSSQESDNLLALTSTVALVGGSAGGGGPRDIRIVNLADPAHPTVAREFKGVTAVGRDSQRGLVFLANHDGVWILRQRFAQDPAALSAYANEVLYDH